MSCATARTCCASSSTPPRSGVWLTARRTTLQAKDEKGIKDEIDKTDRNRAAYYNYYTQNRWGDAHNYDLAINAALGHDACVKMILAAAEAKEKAMEG